MLGEQGQIHGRCPRACPIACAGTLLPDAGLKAKVGSSPRVTTHGFCGEGRLFVVRAAPAKVSPNSTRHRKKASALAGVFELRRMC